MLTHIDENGNAKMVNISEKAITQRMAIASGKIIMKNETLELVKSQSHKKGDVLTVAKIAAIQAAKNTATLIPMCHPVALSSIEIEFDNPEDKNFLELKENEIIKNAALNYYQKTYFDLNVTSLDSIPEDQPIKLNLELYKNGEFMDSATLEIYVIP